MVGQSNACQRTNLHAQTLSAGCMVYWTKDHSSDSFASLPGEQKQASMVVRISLSFRLPSKPLYCIYGVSYNYLCVHVRQMSSEISLLALRVGIIYLLVVPF